MAKVSIVIPVYNAEDFLHESLDSIVNQTLNDIEIICIDDGSTDNSLNILNEYKRNDNRFVVISQKNLGQGVARNRGMELVTGECFCFFDADDKLDLNTLEICYNEIKLNSLDFVMFKLINFDDYSDEMYNTPLYDMYVVQNQVKNNIFNYKDLNEFIFNVSVSPVNKLYDSNFILKNNFKFSEETIFEDHTFFWNMFFSAKKIKFINEYFYFRRLHQNSTTGAGDYRWCDSILVYNDVWNIFKDFNLFDSFKPNLYNNKITFSLYRFDNIQDRYKSLFFNQWKLDLLNIKECYPDFFILLSEENKEIFFCVINSEDYIEFNLLRNILKISDKLLDFEYDISSLSKSDVYKKFNPNAIEILIRKNNNLKIQNHELNKFKNSVLSSNSWKITSPLRYFKSFIKKLIFKFKRI